LARKYAGEIWIKWGKSFTQNIFIREERERVKTKRMKILYTGTNRESSGWGEAARSDLKALSERFDVVSRPIVYSGGGEKDQSALLEEKSLDGITHVIQYCLPQQWERYGTMKHVGYMEVESADISRSRMADYLNMVDEIWVPNIDGVCAVEQVFKGPVKYVPHAIDLSIYEKSYEKTKIPEISGTFTFLCVSENVPRKNLEGLIRAFWIEFDPTEPVSLIIKTDESVFNAINYIKRKLRLYDIDAYQRIVIISSRLSQDQMLGLYQQGDCYVNPSMGESWCLPVVHSLGFNKPVVSSNAGGPGDLMEFYDSHYKVIWSQEPCEGHNWGMAGYQTGHDTWAKPVVKSMSVQMRRAYEDRNYPIYPNNLEKFSNDQFAKNVGTILEGGVNEWEF